MKEAAETEETEPPYVSYLSDHELDELIVAPLKTGVPSHTQATERAVKLTTESAAAVTGTARQDGYGLNKKEFRRRCAGQVTKRFTQ